jgi:phosphohistidine phosphatase
MRHAKSSWQTSEPDHRRPLAKRGVRDATVAGEILAGYQLDIVLASSSVRTRQTWQTAELGGARCDDVQFTDTLYGAWPDSVVELLRELEESVGTAMILGHEPTMSSLIDALAEPSELADEASEHYPTSALAFLEYAGAWADLEAEQMSLVRFEIPRG